MTRSRCTLADAGTSWQGSIPWCSPVRRHLSVGDFLLCSCWGSSSYNLTHTPSKGDTHLAASKEDKGRTFWTGRRLRTEAQVLVVGPKV